jgi:hypothetical protein
MPLTGIAASMLLRSFIVFSPAPEPGLNAMAQRALPSFS